MEILEKKYHFKRERLKRKQKNRLKQIIEEHDNDSEQLARSIGKEFGIKYVKE